MIVKLKYCLKPNLFYKKGQIMNNRLKELRIKLGFNQKSFASELEVNQTTISQYENNEEKAKNITAKSMNKLRMKFNVNMEWLFTGQGSMFLTDSQTVEKIITGNNNQVNIIDSAIKSNFNAQKEVELEETALRDIVNKLKNVHDSKLLNYIDTEITALIQRIQMRKEYGSSFGG